MNVVSAAVHLVPRINREGAPLSAVHMDKIVAHMHRCKLIFLGPGAEGSVTSLTPRIESPIFEKHRIMVSSAADAYWLFFRQILNQERSA